MAIGSLATAAMAENKATIAELNEGIRLPTGERHVLTLSGSRVFRLRLIGLHFETDKTFLLPGAMPGIRKLKQLYEQHRGFKVLVSGHTDTVGSADHNVHLSEERARSIAAFLRDQVNEWMGFYAGRPHSLAWGVREDQHMLKKLEDDKGPFYGGDIDGIAGSGTRNALERFQRFSNEKRGSDLTVNGVASDATREALVKEYMSQDGTTLPEGTELQTHGCGFFHLAVATPPQTEKQANRRVEIFFFEDAIAPPPRKPCPDGGCPEYTQWESQTISTIDFEIDSIDPTSTKSLAIRLINDDDEPLANAKFTLVAAGKTIESTTDAQGLLKEEIPFDAQDAKLTLDMWSVDLEINNLDASEVFGAKARLNNLGLFAGADADDSMDEQTRRAIQRFKTLHGLTPAGGAAPTGDLDGATAQKLREIHGQ
jgi:outer membrane protein OmpA-like peptidoglycan-associated protein